MADSLPTIPDRPDPNFQPPPLRPRVRIEAPPGPIPTQVHSEPPRSNHNHNPNWVRYDTPPHQGRGSRSNAIIIHPPPPGEQNHYNPQLTRGPPPPRFQEIPSTTFHIGPVPPNFTIEQIHSAMKTLNPKVALIDLRSGIVEIEIPFTLTWAQIGDCKLFGFNARYRTDEKGAEGD
jgi:hypothetical protein